MIVKIALPCPLYSLLDYRAEHFADSIQLGQRVVIPFRGQERVGIVMALTKHSDIAAHKLKAVKDVIPSFPIPADLRQLLAWVADYYHYPIGQVVETALPSYSRRVKPPQIKQSSYWQLSAAGQQADSAELKRAPKQAAILRQVQASFSEQPFTAANLAALSGDADSDTSRISASLMKLAARGLMEKIAAPSIAPQQDKQKTISANEWQPLNNQQTTAVETLKASLSTYNCFLLQGITGSGKTEVYLHFAAAVLAQHRQCLVLVPEIGLTPQTVSRFTRYFGEQVVALHSNLNDAERFASWQAIANGEKTIVIGTRSAVFAPFAQLGGIVVDEEHDNSYKQQDMLRYHARDLAIYRSHQLGIPIVLGSATPAFESLHNVVQQRYKHLRLTERAGNAVPPTLQVVDSSHLRQRCLTPTMIEALQSRLQKKEQVLLFLNRRGYAPALMCTACSHIARCHRCDTNLTLHQGRQRLVCHHCGYETQQITTCSNCNAADIIAIGAGTERLEQELQQAFPEQSLLRIDKDTARNKGELESHLHRARQGDASILIGTQMLAKGHDFPDVTLVGVINIDHGLCSIDFRGPEQMAQLLVQVAGRAGRAEKKGHVIIQTALPEHPLLKQLVQSGYQAFAKKALGERQAQALPPFTYAVLVRAEATTRAAAWTFLHQVKLLPALQSIQCLGPASAPMEKRAGRYRAQLWLQAEKRSSVHEALRAVIASIQNDKALQKAARQVRWSIDVDPMDIF